MLPLQKDKVGNAFGFRANIVLIPVSLFRSFSFAELDERERGRRETERAMKKENREERRARAQ